MWGRRETLESPPNKTKTKRHRSDTHEKEPPHTPHPARKKNPGSQDGKVEAMHPHLTPPPPPPPTPPPPGPQTPYRCQQRTGCTSHS